MTTARLRPGMHRVLGGHCWVYTDELVDAAALEPGAIVDVVDARDRFVGRGYANPRSRIAVRLLTRRDETIDAAFWHARLAEAVALRAERMRRMDACRLVHAEADRLPGLVVDRYGDRLVLQASTLGMDRHVDAIADALRALLAPAQIVERSDVAARTHEGLEPRRRVIHGEAATACELRVGAALVRLDLLDPHKTGTYLDQQDSHVAVAGRVRPGQRVLDAFCHLGGFAVHAALAGADAIGIDSSAASVAGARESAQLNGVGGRCVFRDANAFDALKELQQAGERFDLVVLDPPAFSRSRTALAGALRGYKELHLRALRMLPVGGQLATFTCSHHVDAESFLGAVRSAATDARVLLRLEERRGAASDHPVLPQVPESEYLRGFVFSVVERWE